LLPLEQELKQELKNDLWNIINKEKLNKLDFEKAVIDTLLGAKEFNLIKIKNFATKIEEQYDYSLSYFYDMIETQMYNDIIEPIQKTLNIFCTKTKPILEKLKEYRDEQDVRNRRNIPKQE
jgi:hypothetical protein